MQQMSLAQMYAELESWLEEAPPLSDEEMIALSAEYDKKFRKLDELDLKSIV